VITSGRLAPLAFHREHHVGHRPENSKLEASVGGVSVASVEFSRKFSGTTKPKQHLIEKSKAPSITGSSPQSFKALGKFPAVSSIALPALTDTVLHPTTDSARGDTLRRVATQTSKMIEWQFLSTVSAGLHW
jgi:hypothetical protein